MLLFAPHSYIWVHAFPEALIGDALRHQGMQVHYVTCDRALWPWCVAMQSTGANEDCSDDEKRRICDKCVSNKDQLLDHFAFESSSLQDYLKTEDRKEIDSILESVAPTSVYDLEVDGIEVGRACLYDFSLKHKKPFVYEFTDLEWQAFLKPLESCLVAFYAGRAMLEKICPDYALFYSSSYSANLVIRLQAERMNISTFSLYAGTNWGNRLQRMHISNRDSFEAFEKKFELWKNRYRSLPATKKALESTLLFQKTVLGGKNAMVYGGGNQQVSWRSLRSKWGISDEQKVVLMATSSNDELVAAQTIDAIPKDQEMVFSSQLEWISETIEYVSERQDLFLVVRIHPRELPNRRDGVRAPHSEQLERLLKELPENARVNWPSDGLALYDWLEVMDLGLTSWSSAGKEFALWGLPALAYTEEISYYPIGEIGFLAADKADYYKKIDEALQSGWSRERIFKAYRWLAYELEGSVFDLSDCISKGLSQPSLFWRIVNRLTGQRYAEQFWLYHHKSPLKQSELIKNKVVSGKPTEEVLESVRARISNEKEEETEIKSVVAKAAYALFGEKWKSTDDPSRLRQNIKALCTH